MKTKLINNTVHKCNFAMFLVSCIWMRNIWTEYPLEPLLDSWWKGVCWSKHTTFSEHNVRKFMGTYSWKQMGDWSVYLFPENVYWQSLCKFPFVWLFLAKVWGTAWGKSNCTEVGFSIHESIECWVRIGLYFFLWYRTVLKQLFWKIEFQ